jgi:signal transduction histidine kinase/ligand-binding sensor domain-containing protein/DNA-binding response OmpR family regulator
MQIIYGALIIFVGKIFFFTFLQRSNQPISFNMNRKLNTITISIVLILFIIVNVNAQKIRLYNSEQGLPNSLINKVFQDQRGYIWIATENGASYFDGMRFITFRHNTDNKESIASDLVKSFHTDKNGNTWIGSSNGLQIFDNETSSFRNISFKEYSSSDSHFISSIVNSPDKNNIIVSVSGSGIGIIAINSNTHEIDKQLTSKLQKIYNTEFLGNLFIDSKNNLWSYAEQGSFYKLDFDNFTLRKDLWSSELKELARDIVVSSITEDPLSGNLLIGSYKHGLFIYDRVTGFVRRAKGKMANNHVIRTIYAEKKSDNNYDSQIWIGTEGDGLKIFDRKNEDIVKPDLQYSPIDLDNCKVHSIIQDHQGNTWIGVFQKGLLIIPKSSYGFEYIKMTESQDVTSRNQACVTSILRDSQNDLWVGTDGGGLFKQAKTGDIKQFTSNNTSLPNNSILTLAEDKNGTLWITSYMGGITTYNQKTGFQTFSTDRKLNKVNSTYYDINNNKLYLGTLGSGVFVLSINDKKIEHLNQSQNTEWTNSVYLDKSGLLWIGRTNGLGCYNTLSKEVINLSITEKIGESRIYAFWEDSKGKIWIGADAGLYSFDKKTDETEIYTQQNGLPSNLIFSIQEDKKGILWLSTSNGLSRFDSNSKTFKNFYSYDGLQDNEFRTGASFQDRDGKLYFGGINGISAFYPHTVESWKQPMSNIYFTQLSVLNQPVNYIKSQGKRGILDSHISQAKQITLEKEQNVFTLEFAVLEYTNPRKVVYSYMLKGFDSDWRYTNSNLRYATYTNLPDGKYTFKVKAFFEGSTTIDGIAYDEIDIVILPPWYKLWWAYLLYLAFVVVIVLALIYFLNKRRLLIQERMEFERKEMRLRMFTDLSHEIRTPLTLVINPLKSMREAEVNPKRKDMFNLMYRNSLRILQLINQLMDMRKIDTDQLHLHYINTDLIFFVKDIMKSFEQIAIIRNIDFRLLSNKESLNAWIDPSNFDKVLFNILSNAFKFTPDNGYVLITVDTLFDDKHKLVAGADNSETLIEIRLENSGSSIDESELERIFDRFYQSSDDNKSGSGIGLHLAKMIVQKHHGSIVSQNIENGVAFTIRIPVGSEHLSIDETSNPNKHKDLYSVIRDDEKLPKESEYIEIPEIEEDDSFTKNSKSKRTLVFVDDDSDLGKYIRMELSDTYNIEICIDGLEAWKTISSTMPDAVITDLIMPKLDGMSLCRKIRQNPETNHIPVIILTSETEDESKELCIKSGADSYLTKPISLELLKSTVAQTIQTRDLIRNKFRTNINPDFNEIQMSSPDSRLVAKVIESIRHNIENPEFSVDDLSREVGMSRVHLNRKLKENINISPSNLIKSIRLKQAAYLLIKNKVNVSDVAYKVGFSSHSYFSNNFREYFGLTPTEFVVKYMDTDDKEILNKLFDGSIN